MALANRPKPTTHARKRHAGHHRHDKRYLSHYWPYLPMLLIVGLGLFVNSLWSDGSVLGTRHDFSAAALLERTNAERLQQNQPLLTLDNRLTAAAQAKADDMARNDYWSHESPDGKTPWTFVTDSGYRYQRAGENLAYGFDSPDDSVAGWMGSPEHRANMLDISYENVGFGIANSPDYMGQGPKTIVVAEYGQPAAVPAPMPQVLSAQTEAKPVSRIQLLTGNGSQWVLVAVIALSGGAMAMFLLRHGYRVQRLLSRGEVFVVHHPYWDMTIVAIIVAGVVLTRSGGIIH